MGFQRQEAERQRAIMYWQQQQMQQVKKNLGHKSLKYTNVSNNPRPKVNNNKAQSAGGRHPIRLRMDGKTFPDPS